MARILAHLLEEQEDQSKLLRTRDLDIEVERTQEDLKHLLYKRVEHLPQKEKKYYSQNP
jgi:ubiquinone biosynthesis protein COQ9